MANVRGGRPRSSGWRTSPRDLVRPLQEAENQFLQVLVTRFRLQAHGGRLELQVEFAPETPAIWLREAKRHLLRQLPARRRSALQARLEAFCETGQGVFEQDDPEFPFRFGNGGTLPVVRVDGRDHFCLFLRDTHPAGWNIANGGANDLHDLLRPDSIIERELREELVVLDPDRRLRYVFDWHDAHLRDHPDFALANRLWMERFRQRNLEGFEELPLPLKWLPALETERTAAQPRHDSVEVCYGEQVVHTGLGFLNINAEDFGIEFDRIAKLSVAPHAVFCDGEVIDGRLLDRVVGLFEVGRLEAALQAGATAFEPDLLFWAGRNRTHDGLARVAAEAARAREHRPGRGARAPATASFDLCPVTRTIIRRYQRVLEAQRQTAAPSTSTRPYDVFLSFGSEDRPLARQVFSALGTEQRRVFFSDVTMDHGPFARQIDRALDEAWAFVAVASRRDHLYKNWVQYEWESFHNDILSGRKPRQTPFVAFTPGVEPNDLPRPFRLHSAVCGRTDPATNDLQQLDRLVRQPS